MSETPDVPRFETADQLPEYWRNELRSARDEAAKYRTAKNDLGTQLEDANKRLTDLGGLQDQHEKALTDIAARDAELGKLRAVLSAGVPVDRVENIAARLQGATPEEWANDAASLVEMLGQPAASTPAPKVDPSQGRSGEGEVGVNGSEFESWVTNWAQQNL